MIGHEYCHRHCHCGDKCCLHSDTNADNNVCAMSCCACLRDALDGMIVIVGVVLGRQDNHVGTHHPDNPTTEKFHCRSRMIGIFQKPLRNDVESSHTEQQSDAISLLQLLHGVTISTSLCHTHKGDSNTGYNDIHRVHDEGEKEELGSQDSFHLCFGRQGGSQDHGTDDFGCDTLKHIRRGSDAISHHISYKIGNRGRIPWVVFWNALLHLSDQIRPYVRSLGVDSTTQLHKQRHKGCTKTISYQEHWYIC
mmetsp:Transcript_14588/g.33734  ORF Transcript_14588/g.33734 Transcript_14588/m.33734 type:complete len:251 (+) Transcript_14588:2023-2775(+)